MEELKVPPHLTGRHADVYRTKLGQRHKGACSSPRATEHTCPCPHECPLHGRCCDCLVHHLGETKIREADDISWLPHCLKLKITDGKDPETPGVLPKLKIEEKD